MSEPAPVRHTLRNAGIALAVALLVSLTLWMTLPPTSPVSTDALPPPAAGSLPVVADIGGDFTLPSTTGQPVSLHDFRGKVVLLNFGFTHCPDVCPLVLTRIGAALRELERQGADVSRVQPLFVTFDPARDSLDLLKEYVAYFHPSLIGLRGDEAQTMELGQRYKAIFLRIDTGSAGGYVFQHTDYVYVIDSVGRVRLLVGSDDPDAAIMEAVKRLLRDSEKDHTDRLATEKPAS